MVLESYINAANEQFEAIEDEELFEHWEHIPDEDLFEDGELELSEVLNKIKSRVFIDGDWILIRRIDNDRS